jgi:hypothetical protein
MQNVQAASWISGIFTGVQNLRVHELIDAEPSGPSSSGIFRGVQTIEFNFVWGEISSTCVNDSVDPWTSDSSALEGSDGSTRAKATKATKSIKLNISYLW